MKEGDLVWNAAENTIVEYVAATAGDTSSVKTFPDKTTRSATTSDLKKLTEAHYSQFVRKVERGASLESGGLKQWLFGETSIDERREQFVASLGLPIRIDTEANFDKWVGSTFHFGSSAPQAEQSSSMIWVVGALAILAFVYK